MALLKRIETEPRPFAAEPITDEEAAAMFRAALNLFRLWGVTDEQAGSLLDLPRRTFARWKAGHAGRIGRDVNGWKIGSAFGDRAFFDGDWMKRAAAAKAGIFGNDAAEAVYPMTRHDSDGQLLSLIHI